MLKKAVGFLAALAIAASSSTAAFADRSYDKKAAVAVNTDSQEGADAEKPASQEKTEEQIKAEEFAEENCDPQLGKYLDSLEKPTTDFSDIAKEAGGGSDDGILTFGYTNNSLIHNSRFDNMDKVWGIDVSYFQYNIDWNKVKADGIDYAIIRVGYRGYGSGGQLVLDYKFKENIEAAKAAGLDVGVYFYTQAVNTKEAQEEADFVLSYIKDYTLDLPVYYDIESVDYDTGRLDSAGLTKAQKTALCTAFCDRIISKGYKAGVYANMSWLTYQIDGAALGKKYPIWLAHYTTQTNYSGNYSTWQFSSTGKVNGIATSVDMNVDYRDPNGNSNAVGTVTGLSYTTNSDGSVTFKWNKADNAEKYEIFKYDTASKKYTRIGYSYTTQYKTTASASYGYCVRGTKVESNANVYGAYSDVLYMNSGKKITDLKATAGDKSVTLSWSALLGCDNYEIYRLVETPYTNYYTRIDTTTTNSYTENISSSLTNVTYKVRPIFKNGSKLVGGEYSDPVTAVTKLPKVSVPTHTTSTKSSVSVKWSKVKGADGYEVSLYNSATKTYTVQKTVNSSTTTATISGLEAAYGYRVAVRAYATVNGSKVYGNWSSYRTCGTAPEEPSGTYVTQTSGSITLKWNAVSGASSYTVYKKNGGSYTSLGTVSDTTLAVDNTAGNFSTEYVVAASTVINRKALTSAYSAAACLPENPPATPSIISYMSGSDGILTLRWTVSNGCSGYRIYKYDEAKKTYVKVKTVYGEGSVTLSLNDLAANSQFKFRVKAFTKTDTGISWGTSSKTYNARTVSKYVNK